MWDTVHKLAFVPSPIAFDYDESFTALANRSGRMQYYRESRGQNRIRIGRNEFISAFNNQKILALTPIQSNDPVFQFKFFVKQERN